MEPLLALDDSVPMLAQVLTALGFSIVHQDECADIAGALGPLDASEHAISA